MYITYSKIIFKKYTKMMQNDILLFCYCHLPRNLTFISL